MAPGSCFCCGTSCRARCSIERSSRRLRDRRVSMQSVLITGGAGFIGQNLVHAWRAARPSDRLVVVDAMTYAANLRSLEPLIADRSIAFVKGDINDAALIRGLFDEHRFTRVAHLAAESH